MRKLDDGKAGRREYDIREEKKARAALVSACERCFQSQEISAFSATHRHQIAKKFDDI